MAGVHRPLPRTDRARPNPAQALRRRNAYWLFISEVGLLDPASGRVRPLSAREIADLCNCSTRSVQQGLAAARELRELAGD